MKLYTVVVACLAAGATAYVGGKSVGEFLSDKHSHALIRERAERSVAVARSHFRLAVGDTPPNTAFESLEATPISLHAMLIQAGGNPVYIVAIQPTCESCLEEMARIAESQTRFDRIGPFVFVSSGNPRLLSDLRDSLKLQNQFVYDHRRRFLSEFDIDVYPTTFVVGLDSRIVDIRVGDLLPFEIDSIVDWKRSN